RPLPPAQPKSPGSARTPPAPLRSRHPPRSGRGRRSTGRPELASGSSKRLFWWHDQLNALAGLDRAIHELFLTIRGPPGQAGEAKFSRETEMAGALLFSSRLDDPVAWSAALKAEMP